MILLQTFISFIKVGLFSIGGGYAAIPIIQQECIRNYHWLSNAEYINMLAISQLTPGPIGINVATFVGMNIYGILGAMIATIGFVLPSIIIVSIVSHLYIKHNKLALVKYIFNKIRPVMVAIIFSAGIKILIDSFDLHDKLNLDIIKIIIFIVSLYLLEKHKTSIIKIIIAVTLINIILYFIL